MFNNFNLQNYGHSELATMTVINKNTDIGHYYLINYLDASLPDGSQVKPSLLVRRIRQWRRRRINTNYLAFPRFFDIPA
jgi:hypothetical protein